MCTTDILAANSMRDPALMDAAFAQITAAVRRFIRSSTPKHNSSEWPSPDEAAFQHLARTLFALQYRSVDPLLQLCRRRGISPDDVRDWRDIPAVPTTTFKDYQVTSLPHDRQSTVFRSSGTTGHRPSRHFHDAASLATYEASLLPWFEAHLAPEPSLDNGRLTYIALTPSPTDAPESSLAHMFGAILQTWGTSDSAFLGTVGRNGAWHLDAARASAQLARLAATGRIVCLLATAFALVQLTDQMHAAHQQCPLPPGSRALETGGYKGRSRALSKADLHGRIGATLGIPPTHIVSEYGMSELSSQAYDAVVPTPHKETSRHKSPCSRPPAATGNLVPRDRVFHFPPWARSMVVSPEHGMEVAEGETGLLRVVDLANVRSVMTIQTEDLAIRRGHGFELLGRDLRAEPRGCSLRAADLIT